MEKVRLKLRNVLAIAACLAVITTMFSGCGKNDDNDNKAGTPTAPRNFAVTAGNGQAALAWDAPQNDGGAAISKYEVTKDNEWVTAVGSSSHTFTGLINGTEYTFKVRAANENGAGAEAAAKATPQGNLANPVMGVAITPSGDMTVEMGRTVILTAAVTPDNATNKDIIWSSLNTSVAVVNEVGTVTGVSMGTTTIRAMAADGSGKSADKSVTVIPSLPMTGSGTLEDPYIIRTPAHLDQMRNNLAAHYKLGNNVDLSGFLAYGGVGYTKWGTRGWEPIGTFTGSFDGAGFKISGLWINRPGGAYIGLFSILITDWGVQNLGIEIAADGLFTTASYGSGNGYAGGVAAIIRIGNISNCHVTGDKISGVDAGGIAGASTSWGNISNCYTTCAVGGSSSSGGVVGSGAGSITNCYSTGAINGNGGDSGGIAGRFSIGTITNCYATGAVSSSTSLGFGGKSGGVVGEINDGIITDCYATGTVSGVSGVGGVVGSIRANYPSSAPNSIINCYATGTVSGTGDYVGGVVGYVGENGGTTITNCVALSPSVTSSKNTVHIGRVAGFVFNFNMLGNNFAQSNMTVTANGVSKTIIKGGNMLDGADCAATPAANWWTTATPNGPGWSSAIWNFTSGQLPNLK